MNRPILLLVLVVLALFLSPTATAQATNSATRLFLQEIADDFPDVLSSWKGDNYCSGWTGVSCNSAGDVSIDLSGRGLQGKIPSLTAVGYKVNVVSINMSNNEGLYGRLPLIWGGLVNLRDLDLSNTSLDHRIPDSWNGMVRLQNVNISNTYICGGLPNWAMDSLRSIDMSNNKMSGALAYSWSAMDNLVSVNIGGNNFCGCIPLTWKGKSVLNDAAPTSSKADNCLFAIPCWASSAYECPVNDAVIPTATARPGGNWSNLPNAASGVASSFIVVASVLAVLASMIRV